MEVKTKHSEDCSLISVIIPTYNRQRTLGRAVSSVLNQTYRNIEVLIVDDASTDKTEQLIKSINDPRLNYIKLESNCGANYARNIGISKASGDYIAFQDSDDEWLTEKLEKQIEFIKTSDKKPDVVYCSYIRVKGRETTYLPKLEQFRRKGNLLQQLLQGNFITTQSLLVKEDVFKTVGLFDEDMKRLQDWELLIRIAQKYKLSFLDHPLLIAYYSDDSITSRSQLLPESFVKIYKKHLPIIKSSGAEVSFCVQIAKAYIKAGSMSQALRWHWKSIKLAPWQLNGLISLLFTLFGKRGVGLEEKLLKRYRSYLRGKSWKAF